MPRGIANGHHSPQHFEMSDINAERARLVDEEANGSATKLGRRGSEDYADDFDDLGGVPEGALTEEEMMEASKGFWRRMSINAVLIVSWYTFSISITVYNKWMFSDDNSSPDDGDKAEAQTNVFPFPLFTTCVHMLVQFSLAGLVLYLIPSLRPTADGVNPHAPLRRDIAPPPPRDPNKPVMTRWFYFTRIGPCGAATGLDIGLGNMSFRFITLTFYTMCKSSVLGFVLLFAFLFRLERPSWKLGGIIAAMTLGVLMMVAGETAFNTLGFILVMAASASSGFRWSLTQILLIRHPATSNPFSSIFFLAPVMFVTLLCIAVPVEGVTALMSAFSAMATERGTLVSLMILLFPGCLAFAMTASEFALLQRTSVVTLSICGIFKEVLTISTATIVFKDTLTAINATGLVVTIATIAAYNYIKVTKMRADARRDAQLAHDAAYSRLANNEDFDSDRAPQSTGLGRHATRFRSQSVSASAAPAKAQGTQAGSPLNPNNSGSSGSSRGHTPPGDGGRGHRIRHSLSLSVDAVANAVARPLGSPKASPVKRAEDME